MHFLKSFVAGLFTFVFGILVVVTICVFCISSFATKDNIVRSMENTDILKEVKKVKNSGSAEGQSGVTQIINEMYSLASQFSVSEEVVDKIIDSKITKEIVGDTVGNLTDYVVNGKETAVLSEDDVYNVINDNLDSILKSSDVSLDDGQKEKFLREIKKQIPDIVEVIPTSEDLLGSNYENKIEVIQDVFSIKTKVALILCLSISGLIVIILKRKNFEWCANLGSAMLISGLVTIGLSFIMPGIVIDAMDQADLSLLVTSFTNSLSKPILYSGVFVIIGAIILFIIYKKIQKGNAIKS